LLLFLSINVSIFTLWVCMIGVCMMKLMSALVKKPTSKVSSTVANTPRCLRELTVGPIRLRPRIFSKILHWCLRSIMVSIGSMVATTIKTTKFKKVRSSPQKVRLTSPTKFTPPLSVTRSQCVPLSITSISTFPRLPIIKYIFSTKLIIRSIFTRNYSKMM
jgi:hypothetical protein